MQEKVSEARDRAAFARANHSARLEGLDVSAEMLARQERMIRGELTPDEAIREIVDAARKHARTRPET